MSNASWTSSPSDEQNENFKILNFFNLWVLNIDLISTATVPQVLVASNSPLGRCHFLCLSPFPKSHDAKGRQQMGETGFCKNLRFSAVSCENLRFPAVLCANLRLPNPLICRASRKSARICKNLRKCAFQVWFLPFAVSLLARPDIKISETWGQTNRGSL